MSERPLRVCDLCGQVDDHPRARHLFGANEAPEVPRDLIVAVASRNDLDEAVKAAAVDELLDPASACRHMDCCAAAGCPDGTCPKVLAAAGARGETGDSLLALLTTDAVSAVGNGA